MKRIILVLAIICTSIASSYGYNYVEVVGPLGDGAYEQVNFNNTSGSTFQILLGAVVADANSYAWFLSYNSIDAFERVIYGPVNYSEYATKHWGYLQLYAHSSYDSSFESSAFVMWN